MERISFLYARQMFSVQFKVYFISDLVLKRSFRVIYGPVQNWKIFTHKHLLNTITRQLQN